MHIRTLDHSPCQRWAFLHYTLFNKCFLFSCCVEQTGWETWGRRGATLSAAGVVVEQVTCLVMWAGKSCSERERGAETGSPSHLPFVSLKLRWMLSLNHRIPLILLSKDSVILSEILHNLDGGKHVFIYTHSELFRECLCGTNERNGTKSTWLLEGCCWSSHTT